MEEKLVTLATEHYTAAEVLKARLESAGIKVFLKNVNMIQASVSEGVKIQIAESDVENALRLMSEWKYARLQAEKKEAKSIRRILVPVDFSVYSKNACLFALNLAKKYGADIKILHVYYAPIVDLVPITDAYSIQIDMDINLRELEVNARNRLRGFVSEIKAEASARGFEGIRMAYALTEGIAEDEIARAVRDYKPGIVVLGAKGKGDTQGDIIGSVVYKVLDKVRVPVLVIPEHSKYNADKEVNNILYATDFDESDYLAIRRLMTIVSSYQVIIHCVHVSKDPHKKWDKTRMDTIKKYFRKVNDQLTVYCHLLESDDLMKELESFTEKHKIDLFALVNRKRSIISRMFAPSLTKQLVYQSQVPLLVFRA